MCQPSLEFPGFTLGLLGWAPAGSVSLGCSGIPLLEQGQLLVLRNIHRNSWNVREMRQSQLRAPSRPRSSQIRELGWAPCSLLGVQSSKFGMRYSMVSPHSKDLPGSRNDLRARRSRCSTLDYPTVFQGSPAAGMKSGITKGLFLASPSPG